MAVGDFLGLTSCTLNNTVWSLSSEAEHLPYMERVRVSTSLGTTISSVTIRWKIDRRTAVPDSRLKRLVYRPLGVATQDQVQFLNRM
jgi:hypothetical protein